MEYTKEVFDLQLRFAEKISQLTQRPLAESIANYTAFYLLFDLGNDFDWEHPAWKHYIDGVKQTKDIGAWTYQNYQLRQKETQLASNDKHWGCFSYSYHKGDRRIIRPHFANHDDAVQGPLSSIRRSARIKELTAMFLDIKHNNLEAKVVWGETWLYNRKEYTRLFPSKYTESAQVVEAGFKYRALWGQFVKSNGQVQEQLAAMFLKNLAVRQDTQNLHMLFPYQILKVECEIVMFYAFYGISDLPDAT